MKERIKIYIDSLKILSVVLLIFLVYNIFFGELGLNLTFLLRILIIVFFTYSITFLTLRQKRTDKGLPISYWYEWIFYLIGWIGGLVNPVFWLWQYLTYISGKQKNLNLIKNNLKFYRRVYYWGIFVAIVILLGLLFQL